MKIVETNSTYVPEKCRIQYYNYGGSNLNQTVYNQYDTVNRASGRSILYGDNYPDWKGLLSAHLGAVTDLSVTETSITVLSSAVWSGHSPSLMKGPPNSNICKCDVVGTMVRVTANPALPNYRDLVFADNRAKLAYLKKINEEYRAISGLVTLGELSETIRLILRPGRAIVRLTEQFRRDSIKLRRRKPSTLGTKVDSLIRKGSMNFSDLWLQYTFGLIPLLQDIDDGMLALSRILSPGDLPQYVKIVGKSQSESSSSLATASGNVGLFFRRTSDTKTESSMGVKYYGELDRLYAGLNSTSTQLGFDFLSVIPAAWELIPWSFLIDYFTNVGNVIEAVTIPQAGMRWNAMGYIYTKDVTYSAHYNGVTGAYPGDWTGTAFSESVVRARGRILKRVPNVGYVLPTFETPSLHGLASSWKRQANLLALAVTQLRR